MPEKFDFSKIEDQEKFNQFGEDEKEKITDQARDEAELMERLIKSGKAENSQEAKIKIEQIKNDIMHNFRQEQGYFIDIALDNIRALELKSSNEFICNVVKQGLIIRLDKGDISGAVKIINTPEVKPTDEILQEAVKQSIIQNFFKINLVLRIIHTPELKPSEAIIHDEAVKQILIKNFSRGYYDLALEIIHTPELKPSEEIIHEAARQGLMNYFAREGVSPVSPDEYIGNIFKMVDIPELKLNHEILQSAEFQEAIKQRLILCLINKDFDFALRIIHTPELKPSNEIIHEAAKQGLIHFFSMGNGSTGDGSGFDWAYKIMNTPELKPSNEIIHEAVKQGLINCLLEGKSSSVQGIINNPELRPSDEILQSPEVIEAAKQGIINIFSDGFINEAIAIINISEIKLSHEMIKEAVKQGLIDSCSRGRFHRTFEIINNQRLKPSDEILQSPEVQEAIKQGLINCFLSKEIPLALKIINSPELKLNDEILREVIKHGVIQCLLKGDIDFIENIIDTPLEPNDGILQSLEVQKAVKQCFILCLLKRDIESVSRIKEFFTINNIQSHEIIEKNPQVNSFLEKIKILSPILFSQALRSIDLLIELLGFYYKQNTFLNTIRENPFLIDTVVENPRFGSKLLIKYPQLDELSKQNIEFLFSAKKEILASNPNMDSESLECRQEMQEKLKGYENNPGILKQLEKDRINIDEWLDYSETQYFNLESGANVLAFSETVSAPITRIKETLDSYAHTLKEILKQYRPELTEFKIPAEDLGEMKDKIAKMQTELEKAKAEGNEKKIQGIERGIENLQKQIEKVKTVSLWDKLLGDISAFQRLKNDVYGAQEKLIKTEGELQEKLSGKMPSGRMIQELKQKISNAKEELRGKFDVLERRIENFKNNLPELIAPALGEERAGALIQEIEQNLAEQFNHYNTDRSTLANLFSERGDKEKSKMENQPMSIFVWARNPDIDLYQGNYSPCCIRIDSEHMGAESTIADYNTDLGVQIVNIWDEAKNEPITAAWCWIGKNEKGETALVVDNIESNTHYSANYSEQLSKELFAYLENYAKAIGASRIVLGKANNDLPTSGELAKMKDDEDRYNKSGGYNRPDGYFLEAEDKTVKILWQTQEKEKIEKAKAEKAIKVEFQDLNIKNLSEKDFEKIKKLEKKIYIDTGLALGQAMIEDMKSGNGLEYSIVASGKRSEGKKKEAVGYLVALEDKTDEGDPCVYLEDIALLPEAQGQQIGWDMMKSLIAKLKEKARKENKPILLDMHLRETSQRFFERYHNELEQMGVKLLEEALVPDYYDEGEDALYKVYQIKAE